MNVNNVGAYTVDAQTGEVTITNDGWSGFTSTASGGVLYNSGTVNISNSVFKGNSSTIYGLGGGAIFNNGTLNVTNSIFSGNSATWQGGAIYNSGDGRLTLTDTDFYKDRKSTRLNSSHIATSRMPSSA